MASPTSDHDVEASPRDPDNPRTSLSQHSGIGPALSSPASSQHGTEPALDAAEAEWGPQHPCYPHLNPYVPLSSPLHASTRIIRIRRDWMIAGDLAPTFSGLYPEILQDAGLGEGEFRRVVESVNGKLVEIYKPWAWGNVIDAILGLLTGWMWDDLGFTFAKRKLKEVEADLEKWNAEQEKRAAEAGRQSRALESRAGLGSRAGIGSRLGLSGSVVGEEGVQAKFIGLRRSGYLSLDIQIPTPRIGEVDVDEEQEQLGQRGERGGREDEGEGERVGSN